MARKIVLMVLTAVTVTALGTMTAAAQQEEEKTPEEIAVEEADRLEKLLHLEPHQTFYIDSILQHDMRGYHDELNELRASGTQAYTAYKQVKDKWTAIMDSAYRKVLTEYQWLVYRRTLGKLSKEELKKLKTMEKSAKKERKSEKE